MSEQSNGHLELVDRRTGATVGVVVPEGELRALQARVEELTNERDRLQREYDLFRQSMQLYLETEGKPITAAEMEEVKGTGLSASDFRAEIDRLCSGQDGRA